MAKYRFTLIPTGKINKCNVMEYKFQTMNELIQKVQTSKSALENDLDMLKIMIEQTIIKIGATKSSISESMGKSRYYINQVLWRDTTKPEVIIEIAEAVMNYEN